MIYLFILPLLLCYATAYGALAGGRPNAFSEGQNAFAGVVNPANAVWIADRFDLGTFWVYQKSSLNNHDNNPGFPPGKIDLTYRSRNLITVDAAIHKQFKLKFGSKAWDTSCSLAAYTMPTYTKTRTKTPFPIAGTTPLGVLNRTDVLSLVLSFKINAHHSIGFSFDYYYFSHYRKGNQHSDNPLRSVSPGNVTNNGTDHSSGIGCSIGWRWNITKKLNFGAAWLRKSYAGQYRRYKGFEPHHAKNYVPQSIGAGFSYRFTTKLAGRLEVLWSNLGNLPGANNSILPDGGLNKHKRGSKKSPGPGLNDATYITIGMGYKFNELFSLGASFVHRLKLPRKSSNILSHSYRLQTIYNTIALGANFMYLKHDLFLIFTHGFKNSVSGFLPSEIGGGKFTGKRETTSVSFSWGYKY